MRLSLAAALTNCVTIAADGSFVVVAYDNRPEVKSMLQQSAEDAGITYRAGALASHSVRRYHSADRPVWLERELGGAGFSSPISSELRAAEVEAHASQRPFLAHRAAVSHEGVRKPGAISCTPHRQHGRLAFFPADIDDG